MRILRLDLEYDGSGFAGWAAQPGQRTVEGELRRALGIVLREDPELRVAGRTDAGVHAAGQVASVATSSPIAAERLERALGGLLPEDLAATRVVDAPAGFDARADARSRAYEYRLLVGSASPLRRARTLRVGGALDTDAMDAAAAACRGQHDFRAFTPTRTQHVFFARTVLESRWDVRGDELVLCIEADAFLRHMVRVIVGSMLLVGRGTWSVERFAQLLHGAERGNAGPTAPAHPLTLVSVTYPSPLSAMADV